MLLIDSDLRKPAFKAASDKVGLSKMLTTDDTLEDHLVETQHPNLSLLPSGPVPPNPADLLSTGRIRKIIAEASEKFDLVVIDGPPTLGLADAPLLAAAAGNVLFVIESGAHADARRDRGAEPARGHRHPRPGRDPDQVGR